MDSEHPDTEIWIGDLWIGNICTMNIGTIVTSPEIIWLQKRFFMKLPTLKEVGGFMAPPKIEESENSFNVFEKEIKSWQHQVSIEQ